MLHPGTGLLCCTDPRVPFALQVTGCGVVQCMGCEAVSSLVDDVVGVNILFTEREGD